MVPSHEVVAAAKIRVSGTLGARRICQEFEAETIVGSQ
jgi:hypothetical protein